MPGILITSGPRSESRLLGPEVNPGLQLPVGTLGRAFAESLRTNGLRVESIPTLPASNDEEYVSAHLYETHDLWHVVAGFSADVAGEIGLQAVYAAKFGSKLAMLLVAGGLLQAAIRAPHDFANRIEQVVTGWRIGRESRQLFGVAWDELWARPLDDVRRELAVPVAATVATATAATMATAATARASTL